MEYTKKQIGLKRCLNVRCPHFKGEWKSNNHNSTGNQMKMYEVMAVAKRLNYSFDELKQISFTTLINMLLANVEDDTREATQKDIDLF